MNTTTRLPQDSFWTSASSLELRDKLWYCNIDHVAPAHAEWLFENFSSELDERGLRKAVAFWLRCVERKKYLDMAQLFGVSANRARELARGGFVRLMLMARPYQMPKGEVAGFQQQLMILDQLAFLDRLGRT